METIDRYRGAMLGMAVGNALGAPVMGLKGGHILQLCGEISSYVDPEAVAEKKPGRWRQQGLYTNDIQQALALADSLVKRKKFSAAYFADLLVRLAMTNPERPYGAHRGVSANFRSSLDALMGGTPAEASGFPNSGMGAMVRAVPLGLYYGEDRGPLIESAIEQALITHVDPRVPAMAATLSAAIALTVGGSWDSLSPARKAHDLAEAAQAADRVVESEYIHRVPVECMDRFGLANAAVSMLARLCELPDRGMVFRQIVGEANRQFPLHKITEPGQGFVMAAGMSALFIGVTARDFEEGVKEAAHLGKDTHTMGAVVGAMLGARFGESAIPPEWRRGLVNAEQVALRGEALLARSSQGLPILELTAMEERLTAAEDLGRRSFIEKLERKGDLPKPPVRKDDKKKKSKAEPAVDGKPLKMRDKRHKPKREKAPWKS